MDIQKYREMFLTEASEHLQKMAAWLLRVETNPEDQEAIAALFREAHSIKGMAATMGYESSARLAHRLEDDLDSCRELGLITPEQIDYLLAGVDLLELLLEDIRQNQPEREIDNFINSTSPEPEVVDGATEPAGVDPGFASTALMLRIKLDDAVSAPGPRLLVLLKQLEEFGQILAAAPSEEDLLQGVTSRSLEIQLETASSQQQLYEQLCLYSEIAQIEFPTISPLEDKPSKPSAPTSTVRVSTDLLDRFINLTGELITNRYRLQSAASTKDWSELNEGLGQLARLVKNLHHQVLQVRMMPLASITGRLPRAVRDLCRSSGKQVQFEIEGEAIELDRAILEELTDPLTHMIRNAIDHGIEEQGTIQLKAWRERDQVLLQVTDNGCGIDPQAIARKAQDKGLISASQAQSMRDIDLLQLICQPGFSTAAEITETSGRGVGMDIVKTAVERLGGVLLIDSTPGQGTRVTMKLPLSVAIVRVLLIECTDQLMALPLTRVLQTMEVAPADVQTSGKQLVISQQGELVPLLSLRKILKHPKAPPANPIPLVLTEVLGRKVGLVVDRLVGQREIFVQTLAAPFDRLPGNSGGSILGDGRIIFVLDLQSILEKRGN